MSICGEKSGIRNIQESIDFGLGLEGGRGVHLFMKGFGDTIGEIPKTFGEPSKYVQHWRAQTSDDPSISPFYTPPDEDSDSSGGMTDEVGTQVTEEKQIAEMVESLQEDPKEAAANAAIRSRRRRQLSRRKNKEWTIKTSGRGVKKGY